MRASCNVPTCRIKGSTNARSLRSRLVVTAQTSTAQQGGRRYALLSNISKAVEIQASTSRFEVFAGRSAMLGTMTALCIESLTEESLIGAGAGTGVATALAAMGIASIVSGATLAAISRGSDAGVPALLEPVITSLTAAKRSASGVSESRVDDMVDDVVLSAFTASMLLALTTAGMDSDDESC